MKMVDKVDKVDKIEVNGKKIFSNKIVSSVIGTRVNFTDGSWCDVETGEVLNNGPGSIFIGVPTGETNKKETKEKSFKASALSITDLCADVDIQIGGDSQIRVKVEASASVINNVDVSESGNTVRISGKGIEKSGSVNITSRGNSINIANARAGRSIFVSSGNITIDNCSISGNNISIGRAEMENETKIIVIIPKGTPINVSDISGQVNIGDTEGYLNASIVGRSKIFAGYVKDACLSLQGGGDIRVEKVSGRILTAKIMGSGDIRIKEGNVATLVANVTGSGDVKFGGSADNATLAVIGSGDIRVADVKNRPITHITGNGDIDVGNWD